MTTPRLTLALIGIAALSIAVPAYVVSNPPKLPPQRANPAALAKLQRRVVPQAELPPVEPVDYVQLSPEDARAYNASVPFSTEPNPAARPFRFQGTDEEKARALDCLAAAVIYEAGDDAPGERAVAQVVLNRLRHPAFPKTVCGVVFEGSERTTGCQFTFTCDGALTRWTPSEAGWRRAREIAGMALAGSVDKPVGYATHYHTDWVVPYWQSSLDKIAMVHTHLFFRWSGWWGTPPAFNRQQAGAEPVIAQLAAFSDAHKSAAALAEADAALSESDALVNAAGVGELAAALTGTAPPEAFAMTLDPRLPPDAFRLLANRTCGDRPRCKLLGWISAQSTPKSADAVSPEQMGLMSFSYLRDRDAGFEKALWNCRQFKRADPRECMKQQVQLTGGTQPTPSPSPAATPTARAPADLSGVRRSSAAAPAAAPET